MTMSLTLITDAISKCLFPDHVLHKELSDAEMFLAALRTIPIAMLLEVPLQRGVSTLQASRG